MILFLPAAHARRLPDAIYRCSPFGKYFSETKNKPAEGATGEICGHGTDQDCDGRELTVESAVQVVKGILKRCYESAIFFNILIISGKFSKVTARYSNSKFCI